MEPISFRQFMELEEKEVNHFTALADELGVDPKAFVGSPQVGSFFKLGDIYNLGAYKIIGFEMDDQDVPTHARVQLVNRLDMPRKRYKMKGEDPVRIPDNDQDADDKIYLVPVDQLQNLMMQPLLQTPSPEMGGLPGGGMPGGGMM